MVLVDGKLGNTTYVQCFIWLQYYHFSRQRKAIYLRLQSKATTFSFYGQKGLVCIIARGVKALNAIKRKPNIGADIVNIILYYFVPCKKILHHKSTRPIQNLGTWLVLFIFAINLQCALQLSFSHYTRHYTFLCRFWKYK